MAGSILEDHQQTANEDLVLSDLLLRCVLHIVSDNEELAEILVYSEDDEWYGRQWFSFDGDHIRNAFPTKQDAIKSTIDWLNSLAESEVK